MARFIVSIAAVLFAFGSALAAEPPESAMDEPAASVDAPEAAAQGGELDIQTATCGDLFDLYEDAVPGEGKDPAELERAQDTILLFVVWVHGYLSGRDGINPVRRPLSKEGIEITVADIAEVCEPDESKRFLDVVDEIKK